jgi:glyoxylase-like metal-dependent hydrolase (beta-lactamase superfamily II)/rhodanese-related sulfurtransferase
MYFKQFYLGCLAQASYLIGSEGEAAVVDPRRDVDEYLEEAWAQGLAIKYVVETHLHADFVSGHRELGERTGAAIVIGAAANAAFPHRAVRDGDEIALGRLRLRFLETPGHTPESISVLVFEPDVSPEPKMVLTGDTLFIGDVGRPDLLGSRGISAEAMAGMLYDTLHGKLLPLPDATLVYPAHGAGSLCGRNMSKETWSTIGEQRRSNHALQPMSREAFVRLVATDLPEVPAYFPHDVALNREGAASIEARPLPPPLTPAAVAERQAGGACVLDVRAAAVWGAGHVPGSLNIGLGGQFASWAGTLIEMEREVVLVAENPSGVAEAVMRLSRVGLDHVVGHLEGGVGAWERAGFGLATVPQVTVADLKEWIDSSRPGLQVVDVRRPGEYEAGHVPGASLVPLDRLPQELDGLDTSRPTVVICAGGYRSSAATSLLRPRGFGQLFNVTGGTAAWLAAGYPAEGAPACASRAGSA